MQFGKFDSFEAFIEAYTLSRKLEELTEVAGQPFDIALARRRKGRSRDVVEVRGPVVEYLGTETSSAKHQHIIVNVTEVTEGDPDVAADLDRVITETERVFVSVRYGDRMGIPAPVPGIEAGVELHLEGEWIPREKAYAHGGERLSVLHFTHEPLGFICNEGTCFS